MKMISRTGASTRSASTSDVTDENDVTAAAEGRRKRRTHQRSPSVSTYHSITRRLSVGTNSIVEETRTSDNPTDRQLEAVHDNDNDDNTLTFFALNHSKKLTVVNFCLTNFCAGCFYSILGPFFPAEAAEKGISSTVVGFIFGMFELTIVIASPILGKFISQIGAKFMYVTGVMVCGSAGILFGFLDRSPDGVIYAVMCFLVRFVEAIGAAGLSTSSFAIIAHTFPNNVATMFGSLELFSGLGLMVGPLLGGVLFEFGGFTLPFAVLGSVSIIVGLISIFVLPSQDVHSMQSNHSMFELLKIPIVSIMGLCLMSASGSIGFFDVALSVYLKAEYNLSPIVLGAVFLAGPGGYAVSAPLWGWIVDRTTRYSKIFIICGYTLSGIAFFLMGPAPFIPIPHMLWLVILTVTMVGFGIGTAVITFQIITKATLENGYEESLVTFGLIAGVFNSFFSFGAFIGPLGGGYLTDVLNFEMAAVIVGCCCLLAALLLTIHVLITSVRCGRCRLDDDSTDSTSSSVEKQPLISSRNSHQNGGDRIRSQSTEFGYRDHAEVRNLTNRVVLEQSKVTSEI